MISGFLRKLTSKDSIFKEGKFQHRFFVLDLKRAMFKYAKNENTWKFREFPFKNIISVQAKDYYISAHKDFPFPFIVAT